NHVVVCWRPDVQTRHAVEDQSNAVRARWAPRGSCRERAGDQVERRKPGGDIVTQLLFLSGRRRPAEYLRRKLIEGGCVSEHRVHRRIQVSLESLQFDYRGTAVNSVGDAKDIDLAGVTSRAGHAQVR